MNGNRLKSGAISKQLCTNLGRSARDRYALQGITTTECIICNNAHALGDRDRLQIIAIIEGVIADKLGIRMGRILRDHGFVRSGIQQEVRVFSSTQILTALLIHVENIRIRGCYNVRVIAGSQRFRQNQLGQCGAVSKGRAIDRGDTVCDHDLGDIGILCKRAGSDLQYRQVFIRCGDVDLRVGATANAGYRVIRFILIKSKFQIVVVATAAQRAALTLEGMLKLFDLLRLGCAASAGADLNAVCGTGGLYSYSPIGILMLAQRQLAIYLLAALGAGRVFAAAGVTGGLGFYSPDTADIMTVKEHITPTGPHHDVIDITVDSRAKLKLNGITIPSTNGLRSVCVKRRLGYLDKVNHISRLHVDVMTHSGLPLQLDSHLNVCKHMDVFRIIVFAHQLIGDRCSLCCSFFCSFGCRSGVQIGCRLELIVGLPRTVEVALVVTVTANTEHEGVIALAVCGAFCNQQRGARDVLRIDIFQFILQSILFSHKRLHVLLVQYVDLIITVHTADACIVRRKRQLIIVVIIQSAVNDGKLCVGLVIDSVVFLGQLSPADGLQNGLRIAVISIIEAFCKDQSTVNNALLAATGADTVHVLMSDHIDRSRLYSTAAIVTVRAFNTLFNTGRLRGRFPNGMDMVQGIDCSNGDLTAVRAYAL